MNAYEIIRTFGAVVLLAAASVQCSSYHDIHKRMTPEELQYVFLTDSVHSLPEYNVVKLHMPQHNTYLPSGSRIHTTAFGLNINLWLHPTDSILAGSNTPVYYAQQSPSKPQGVEYRLQHGLMATVGQIFEDPRNLASLVIGTDYSGRTMVNGFIQSKRLAIRSLPQRVVDEYTRERRSIDGIEDPQYSPYHVIIKINETVEGKYSHTPAVNETSLPERSARSTQTIPEILYPEVLVVVDHSVYRAFTGPQGFNVRALLMYLLAFWNSVDLKYRSVVTPKIRFNIAAIVIGVDKGAIPYIEKNVNNRNGSESLSIDVAMADSEKFWYGVKDAFPFDSYDIAATMTRRILGFRGEYLGKARTESICQRSDIRKTVDAVTIFSDNAAFSGVETIAHEIGHTFGAWHDIDRGCDDRLGYLMTSGPQGTIRSSDLSPCSLKDIQARLQNQQLRCLYNRPKDSGQSLPRILPGKMKTLEPPCKFWRGGASCQHLHPEHTVCVKMFCFDEHGVCVDTRRGALDGTQCGTDKDFCLHQSCVRL